MVLTEFPSACCLLGLLSDPEGGGSKFLQNFSKFLPEYIPPSQKIRMIMQRKFDKFSVYDQYTTDMKNQQK
jgi:hypothetical protein